MQTLTITPTNEKIFRKQITWPTNHNNKMHCDCIIHIDLPPTKLIPESAMTNTIVEILTSDNTHPPQSTWKLFDLMRLPLHKVDSSLSIPSHGMDSFEFAKWFMQKASTADTCFPVAIYFYRKFCST